MNHVVCIAYVPDTETKIKIGADGKSIDEADVKWIVSPYDEYALEEALKTKEAKGGTVTVVTYGPARADAGLRECLARGADEAIRIASEGTGEIDSLGVAQILAGAVKALPHDIVWMGNKGVGTDAQLLVPMVAELLDLPHVSPVMKLEWGDGKITAKREIEGATEVVEAPLPVVLGAQKGLNEPRYASLKGIMAAKKKTIAVKQPADVGYVPAAGGAVTWTKLELPAARGAVKLIPADDPNKAAEELLRLLRDESEGAVMSNVLVFIEQRDGKIRKASLEALTLGRTLAGKTGGTVAACVAGSGIGTLAPELAAYGAAKVFVADAPELQLFSCEGYTAALDAAVSAFSPSILLVSATTMGKDLAPRLAARRKVGVLSDVMTLDVEGGHLVGTRPVYSGKARATVTPAAGAALQIATPRPNVFPASKAPAPGAGEVVAVSAAGGEDPRRRS